MSAELMPLLGAGVLLILTAVPVALSRNKTIRARWATWAVIGVVTAAAAAGGVWGAAALAILISVLCIREYRKLAALDSADAGLLLIAAVAFPLTAVLDPTALVRYLPFAILAAGVLPLLGRDPATGATRAAFTAFGMLWLAWAPAQLVHLAGADGLLVAVILTVAVTDIASWAGGKTLGKLPLLRTHPFGMSPNKTIGGSLAGAIAAALTLLLLGQFSVPLLLAIAVGAPAGDLLASTFKRHAKVKDAGSWLPGFGGLLDRADSLLIVAPLAALLT